MPDYPGNWLDALEVRGNSPEGVTEAFMMAHGISAAVVAALVDSGLATTVPERRTGERTVSVTRFKITDRGRVALGR